jgi:hypothetical protein
MDLPGGTCHVWCVPRAAAAETLTAVLERDGTTLLARAADGSQPP